MIRMLIIGYCYGIRFERRLCEEVELHLAYRWFCRLDLEDKIPDHSTFSVNRHGRFRDSDLFRHVFEAVVRACMDAGLVKGEAFAVDASVMEADASRYHDKAPDEIDWSLPERQTRAVAEFLGALDDEDPDADRKLPKAISPVDPCSAWTAKANKRVQFGYGLNYLIDVERAVIVDVEATAARNVYVCPANKLLKTTGNAGADRGATAAHVHSSRDAVQTRPRARSHATSRRMPAIMRAASWVRRSSSGHAMSARRSRCALRTSKPITASSDCACAAYPVRAMSSTSLPSCRTSRPWRNISGSQCCTSPPPALHDGYGAHRKRVNKTSSRKCTIIG
jgi:IS5 family transposase